MDQRPRTVRSEWFALTVPAHESPPTDEQQAFMAEARELLESLRPVRAQNTWATIYGGLILVVPLDRRQRLQLGDRGSLHTSLQLLMGERAGRQVILGAWHDAHYAWDYEPKPPEFRVEAHDREARRQALDWLRHEMCRPILRFDLCVFGRTLGSLWRFEEGDRAVIESRGVLPLGDLLGGGKGVPAGYFDPW